MIITKPYSLLFYCLMVILACSSQNNKVAQNCNHSLNSDHPQYTIDELKGIWWNAIEEDAPSASFKINDSTIYYPDQDEGQSVFRYQLKQDSLIVYFDGSTSISKIAKTKNDTLELVTNGEKQTFLRKK